MPNVMAALLNIGVAVCSTPQSLADDQVLLECRAYESARLGCKVWLASVKRRRCSKEAKTRNPLKFAGVPQTNEPTSAANGSKFSNIVRTYGGDIAV